MSDITELIARIKEAEAKGDTKAIEAIAAEIVKSKTDRAKAEAEGLRKEAEALAGKREALAKKIHQQLHGSEFDKLLVDVKSWGFTYKVDKANPAEPDIMYKSVSLSTQQVKARKAGAGGGAGRTKDELGMSLQEVYDKFADQYTADTGTDIGVDMQEALEKDKTVSNQGYSYNVKKRVKKWALDKGLVAPAK